MMIDSERSRATSTLRERVRTHPCKKGLDSFALKKKIRGVPALEVSRDLLLDNSLRDDLSE